MQLAVILTAAAVALGTPQPPAVARATLTAESQPLNAAGDNEPQLRAFIDSLPNGANVVIPAGTWRVDRPLKVTKAVTLESEGEGESRATIVAGEAAAGRGAIEIGDDTPGGQVDGATIRNLIVRQQSNAAGVKNCVVVHGDGFTMRDTHLADSKHEGLVISATSRGANIEDCTAADCGLGSPSYTLPTAAFNSHAIETNYKRCSVRGSGHGIEASNTGTTIDACDVAEPGTSFAGTQGTAYVVGSAGMGVYRLTIKHSRSTGYANAVNVGNGIGRLTEVDVVGNRFDGGGVSFMGGKTTNNVPHPDEGPDLSPIGSRIRSNTFIVRGPTQGLVIYNTGPQAGVYDVFGREKLTVEDNAVFCVGPHGTSPLFGVAGRVVGQVAILRNKVFGSPQEPSRGDVATFTNNANLAVPAMPIDVAGNVAYKADGTERPVVVKIENP
jgi:hypothetical protein